MVFRFRIGFWRVIEILGPCQLGRASAHPGTWLMAVGFPGLRAFDHGSGCGISGLQGIWLFGSAGFTTHGATDHKLAF